MKRLPKRALFLGLALVVTLGASVWTYLHAHETEPDAKAIDVSARLKPVAENSSKPEEASDFVRRHSEQTSTEEAVIDLFEAKSWNDPVAAPPLSVQPQPIPDPVAPPLPFQYFGKTEVAGEPGSILIHLIKDGVVYSVRVGENIDQNYKLEKMGEDSVLINYLPLSTKQTLFTGSK